MHALCGVLGAAPEELPGRGRETEQETITGGHGGKC